MPHSSSRDTIFSADLKRAVDHFGAASTYFLDGTILPDDIVLASYPRSGSHFARFIILSAIFLRSRGEFPKDFSGLRGVPDVHGGDLAGCVTRPRIVKTHYPHDPRYRQVIHLVRDPRDVLTSYYFFSRSKRQLFFDDLPAPPGVAQFADLFIRGRVWPGDLYRHTASFDAARRHTSYLIVRYESLVRQERDEFAKLLDFAGVPLDGDALARLVEHTRFQNMSGFHDAASAQQGGAPERREQMLRKGAIGDYANLLAGDTLKTVNDHFRDYMTYYGYETGGS